MKRSSFVKRLWDSSSYHTNRFLGFGKFCHPRLFYLKSPSRSSHKFVKDDNSEMEQQDSNRPGTTTIDAEPDPDLIIRYEGKEFKSFREGLAHILIPAGSANPKAPKAGQGNVEKVFYNPVQQFNRDLSVLAIRAYGEDRIALKEGKFGSKAKRKLERRKSKQKPSQKAAHNVGDENNTNLDTTPQQPAQQGTKRKPDALNDDESTAKEHTEEPNAKKRRTHTDSHVLEESYEGTKDHVEAAEKTDHNAASQQADHQSTKRKADALDEHESAAEEKTEETEAKRPRIHAGNDVPEERQARSAQPTKNDLDGIKLESEVDGGSSARNESDAEEKTTEPDAEKPPINNNADVPEEPQAGSPQPMEGVVEEKTKESDAKRPQPYTKEDGTQDPQNEPSKPTGSDKDEAKLQDEGKAETNEPTYAEPGDPQPRASNDEGSTNGKVFSTGAPSSTHTPNVKLRILDALSASGLRALRYAKELPFKTSVTANDLSAEATKSISANVRHNKLDSVVLPKTGDALGYMYSYCSHSPDHPSSKKYDVVDIDPYGTAVPYLDAALHAVSDGGMLCISCTDAGVWASTGYPEKTFSLYGGSPLKGLHSHEAGLRLIIHSIATAAARQSLSIEPLLSLSADFYARIFVRVKKSPAEVKFLAGKTMLAHNCDSGCGSWSIQHLGRHDSFQTRDGNTAYKHHLPLGPTASPMCEHCGFKTHVGGPMYGGPLHNAAFIERMLRYLPTLDKGTYGTLDRIKGVLSTVLEETSIDQSEDVTKDEIFGSGESPIPPSDPAKVARHPFCIVPKALAGVLRCICPSDAKIKGAIRHAGFKAVRSHTKPGAISTTAPWEFIWEMMRQWIQKHANIKPNALKPTTAGYKIMYQDESAEIPSDERVANTNGEGDQPSAQGKEDKRSDKDKQIKKVGNWKVIFDAKLGQDASTERLVRYQLNPEANWGPMQRAKG